MNLSSTYKQLHFLRSPGNYGFGTLGDLSCSWKVVFKAEPDEITLENDIQEIS